MVSIFLGAVSMFLGALAALYISNDREAGAMHSIVLIVHGMDKTSSCWSEL